MATPKVGEREFRERIASLDTPVAVTRRDEILDVYVPTRRKRPKAPIILPKHWRTLMKKDW